jgi:hypothetical protein
MRTIAAAHAIQIIKSMHAVDADQQNMPDPVTIIQVLRVDHWRHAHNDSDNSCAECFDQKVNPPGLRAYQPRFAIALNKSNAFMTNAPGDRLSQGSKIGRSARYSAASRRWPDNSGVDHALA